MQIVKYNLGDGTLRTPDKPYTWSCILCPNFLQDQHRFSPTFDDNSTFSRKRLNNSMKWTF